MKRIVISIVSGPTVPTMADVTARNTAAAFPIAGTYVLSVPRNWPLT